MIERATVEHTEMIARAGINVLKDLPNYAGVPYSAEHSNNILNMILPLDDVGCFFKQVDGEVVGLFIGVIAPQWFTPQKEMSEAIFWVHPDHRTAGLARKLIRAMEEWAKSKGAVKLFMAAASGYQTERVEKFYNRLGYATCALTTCKEV